MDQEGQVVSILGRATSGDRLAAAELLPLVYGELKALASNYLKQERPGHTLQPTALVHEAYIRMAGADREWAGKSHFLAVAAVAMRNVLVDHARRRGADKRSGELGRVTLDAAELGDRRRDVEVLELDGLIERLAELDPRRARVVELKFFAAMTNDQIAEVLGVSRSTVAEDWTVARAWLGARAGGE